MIGLTYTHKQYSSGAILLPNYIYLLQKEYTVESTNEDTLHSLIESGELLSLLQDEKNDIYFNHPLLRRILLEAYPYEVDLKFLQKDVQNNDERNQRIISLFDEYFGESYKDIMSQYSFSDQAGLTDSVREKKYYESLDDAVDVYRDFFFDVIKKHGDYKDIQRLEDRFDQKLAIGFVDGISGVYSRGSGGMLKISLGNKTYTTLFHELTHAMNSFFREDIMTEKFVCDSGISSNEGISNFVAYHCLDAILKKDISLVEELSVDPMFFSMYIDIYKTLITSGTTDRQKNKQLVHHELMKFEGSLLTEEKSDFYYQRFYKFFHYDQSKYFFPKELMYYIGYRTYIQMFQNTQNKCELLVQAITGKICL